MSEHLCPADHAHGEKFTCYTTHGCRCVLCRGMAREYGRTRRGFDPLAVDLAVDGIRVWLTAEQRAEAVHRLWLRRWSDPAIAAHLGITDRSVMRIRHRHGWRAWEMFELQKMREAA